MPANIDPETLYVDDLPGIWSPIQWELTEEERQQEVEQQATASLLWTADAPEAVLRLLLSETDIERIFDPPAHYDPDQQGEWNPELVTFSFKRPIRLVKVERQPDYLYVEYNFEDLGYWGFEIEPDKITIQRL
jgi:hypothetical protein